MTEHGFDQPGAVRFLLGMFEGTLPNGDLAGYGIYAGPDSPPEALEQTASMAVRGLEMKYPGIKDVSQVGDWKMSVMYLDEDTEDETTEDA